MTLRKYCPHLNGWKDVVAYPKKQDEFSIGQRQTKLPKIALFKLRQQVDKEQAAAGGGAGSAPDSEKKLNVAPGSQWVRVTENGANYYWHPHTNEVQVETPPGFLSIDLPTNPKQKEQEQEQSKGQEQEKKQDQDQDQDNEQTQKPASDIADLSSTNKKSRSGTGKLKGKRAKGRHAHGRGRGGPGAKRKGGVDPETDIVEASEQWTEEQFETWLRHTLSQSGTPMRAPVPARVKGMIAALHTVRQRRAALAGLEHFDMDEQAENMELDLIIESLGL
jgi:hypothetical protein